MVDFFLLLKIAGAGDELQGIKRGIIEMADAIVINKADGENKKNADIAKVAFNKALHLYPPKESKWQPKVLTASALKNKGIAAIDQLIANYVSLTKQTTFFQQKRDQQNTFWLLSSIEQQLKDSFYQNPSIKKALAKEIKKLENAQTTPFSAAKRLLDLL
jgi:LAO/AO transport system kinase